ncbi:unnamed protein product [Meloidogyne enterolobii]|uniref:Uncharacterized protein n=1 Tax=Meloidogyne enterolobii TaxID=390850 RepID=A0ACB1A5S0_MELEN
MKFLHYYQIERFSFLVGIFSCIHLASLLFWYKILFLVRTYSFFILYLVITLIFTYPFFIFLSIFFKIFTPVIHHVSFICFLCIF